METKELLTYVQEARKAGLNNDQIKQRLSTKDWQESDINHVLTLNDSSKPVTSSHSTVAVLSYFGILIVIPYLVAKDDPFVKFHIDQGLILFVLEMVYWLVRFLASSLNVGFISTIFFWALLILNLIGILNVFRGTMTPLPIVGKLVKTKI